MALHIRGRWLEKYGDQAEVNVPDSTVVIPQYAFQGSKRLRYISLPERMERIGIGAFSDCKALEKIVLPSTIDSIEFDAFSDCENLKEIELPQGLTEIKSGTFSHCKSLEYIKIPEGVTKISSVAFSDCTSLKKISLPDSLREIGEYAFSNCINLIAIEGGDCIRKIDNFAFGNCIKLSKFKLGSSIDSISEKAFLDSSYKLPNYILVDLNKKYTFDGVVRIPDGVLSITEHSLVRNESNNNCCWNKVILPDSVRNISYNAFYCIYNFIFDKNSYAAQRLASMPDKMNMPQNYFRQKTQFDAKMALLLADTVWKKFVTQEDFEYMLLYQNSKAAQYGACDYLSDNCSYHLSNMMKRTDNSPLQLEHLAAYAATYLKRIDLTLLDMLKKRAEKYKAYSALKILDKYCFAFLNNSNDEITNFCMRYFSPYKAERYFPEDYCLKPLLNRVRFKYNGEYVPEYLVKCVLAAYMEQLPENIEELEDCDDFNIVREADFIASEFDSESFMRVIDELSYEDMKMLIPICRYGGAKTIAKICMEVKERDALYYLLWKNIAKKALALSENDEAMAFAEGIRYAESCDDDEEGTEYRAEDEYEDFEDFFDEEIEEDFEEDF